MLGPLIKAIYYLAETVEINTNKIKETLDNRALGRIEHKIDRILHHEVVVSQELDDLKREVEETKAKVDEIILAVTNIRNELVAVRQQLADAIAANDPAAIAAAASELDSLQTKIDAALTP